ncbi:MAG: hypothetical protein RLZZ561_1873 [Pseudomonadota bacterium]|jgi:AraC-like DNA-binding protein
MICSAVPPPDRLLLPFIDSYVCLSSDQSTAQQKLPAGWACLWILVRGRATLDCDTQTRKSIWPETLTGPFHRHHRLGMIGPTMLFGARITPAGWGGLIPQEAHRLADQAGNATLLLGPAIEQLQAAMAKCTQLPEMAELATSFFADRIKSIPLSHQRVNQALSDWLASTPRATPDILSEQLNMSARQVERIANRYWGAPPRTLARIDRALHMAACIRSGENHPTPYADASHLSREVKRVTGYTPRQLMSLGSGPFGRPTDAPKEQG